ncbi:Coiled-coil domain-containing protein 130 [Galdieria sulphuraria]|uniref:Coiled-coil domain-containing protein 130 n=1 Tax=Galdieria sulphuraria TaxID=130081 RepID=M2XB13_GALSU|nr:uncharacterized protein Gasu_53130 [Galdieria sulphuraria]EME27092.1 hypothetical protein Gasu_53130 [Galdieria sulphuraria]GJD05650.1 Coiled-coil domain-containing protein 130 [Galdieria sulphuraria]|eukprot:XP_005703612.1 hypothetical protein Gasu_53130 [Galdieria sulphuraria]
MADRKAVQKYYPPAYFDYLSKGGKKSINMFQGQHPLRERARKLKSQGILIIRFEMPFNIWCLGCNNHIGKGVRYNAEKKKVGSYFSTTIWNFRFKCHLCDNYIEIQTDPASRDYVVVAGGKRKEEGPGEGDIWIEEATQQTSDAFEALEKEQIQLQVAKTENEHIQELESWKKKSYEDDYASSQLVRKRFREWKKALTEEQKQDEELASRLNLFIPLVPKDKSTTPISKPAASGAPQITRITPRKSTHILPRAKYGYFAHMQRKKY